VGVIISIITVVISIVLYTIGGATFSILTNFVSDLGATNAPNNAFIAFNTGLILNSIVSPFGTLFLTLIFLNNNITQKWIVWFWFSTNVISAIATFLVALFPENAMIAPHVVAAIITFFFGMLSYIIYGIITLKIQNLGKYHSISGFLLASINFVFMFSWVFRLTISVITMLEWIVLFGGWAFGIYLGLMCLKLKEK
jgi:hypothetical membrane protein